MPYLDDNGRLVHDEFTPDENARLNSLAPLSTEGMGFWERYSLAAEQSDVNVNREKSALVERRFRELEAEGKLPPGLWTDDTTQNPIDILARMSEAGDFQTPELEALAGDVSRIRARPRDVGLGAELAGMIHYKSYLPDAVLSVATLGRLSVAPLRALGGVLAHKAGAGAVVKQAARVGVAEGLWEYGVLSVRGLAEEESLVAGGMTREAANERVRTNAIIGGVAAGIFSAGLEGLARGVHSAFKGKELTTEQYEAAMLRVSSEAEREAVAGGGRLVGDLIDEATGGKVGTPGAFVKVGKEVAERLGPSLRKGGYANYGEMTEMQRGVFQSWLMPGGVEFGVVAVGRKGYDDGELIRLADIGDDDSAVFVTRDLPDGMRTEAAAEIAGGRLVGDAIAVDDKGMANVLVSFQGKGAADESDLWEAIKAVDDRRDVAPEVQGEARYQPVAELPPVRTETEIAADELEVEKLRGDVEAAQGRAAAARAAGRDADAEPLERRAGALSADLRDKERAIASSRIRTEIDRRRAAGVMTPEQERAAVRYENALLDAENVGREPDIAAAIRGRVAANAENAFDFSALDGFLETGKGWKVAVRGALEYLREYRRRILRLHNVGDAGELPEAAQADIVLVDAAVAVAVRARDTDGAGVIGRELRESIRRVEGRLKTEGEELGGAADRKSAELSGRRGAVEMELRDAGEVVEAELSGRGMTGAAKRADGEVVPVVFQSQGQKAAVESEPGSPAESKIVEETGMTAAEIAAERKRVEAAVEAAPAGEAVVMTSPTRMKVMAVIADRYENKTELAEAAVRVEQWGVEHNADLLAMTDEELRLTALEVVRPIDPPPAPIQSAVSARVAAPATTPGRNWREATIGDVVARAKMRFGGADSAEFYDAVQEGDCESDRRLAECGQETAFSDECGGARKAGEGDCGEN